MHASEHPGLQHASAPTWCKSVGAVEAAGARAACQLAGQARWAGCGWRIANCSTADDLQAPQRAETQSQGGARRERSTAGRFAASGHSPHVSAPAVPPSTQLAHPEGHSETRAAAKSSGPAPHPPPLRNQQIASPVSCRGALPAACTRPRTSGVGSGAAGPQRLTLQDARRPAAPAAAAAAVSHKRAAPCSDPSLCRPPPLTPTSHHVRLLHDPHLRGAWLAAWGARLSGAAAVPRARLAVQGRRRRSRRPTPLPSFPSQGLLALGGLLGFATKGSAASLGESARAAHSSVVRCSPPLARPSRHVLSSPLPSCPLPRCRRRRPGLGRHPGRLLLRLAAGLPPGPAVPPRHLCLPLCVPAAAGCRCCRRVPACSRRLPDSSPHSLFCACPLSPPPSSGERHADVRHVAALLAQRQDDAQRRRGRPQVGRGAGGRACLRARSGGGGCQTGVGRRGRQHACQTGGREPSLARRPSRPAGLALAHAPTLSHHCPVSSTPRSLIFTAFYLWNLALFNPDMSRKLRKAA